MKMSSSWCVLVEREDGERIRQWLIKNSLLDQNFKVEPADNLLIFPLTRELSEIEKNNLLESFEHIQFEHLVMKPRQSRRPVDLFTALENIIPKNLHSHIPKSFDVIGQLTIIEIPEELESYKELVGEKILELHPSQISVYQKKEPIQGDYRLRNLQLIAGVDKTETIYRENKCVYELDIRNVYFSPRLVTEHARVCSMVKGNEIVLDMFAGIGPFSVLIAKQKQVIIYAVDMNQAAIYYLNKNIILNKIEKYVKVLEGDVREVIKNVSNLKFNRIIMNLPSRAAEFLDTACQVLEKGGIIHYYQFVPEEDYPEHVIAELTVKIEGNHRRIKEILQIRKVRPYAPYIWHIGVDILVE